MRQRLERMLGVVRGSNATNGRADGLPLYASVGIPPYQFCEDLAIPVLEGKFEVASFGKAHVGQHAEKLLLALHCLRRAGQRVVASGPIFKASLFWMYVPVKRLQPE